jgi:peptide/nickel transport system ATP-binding protein
VPRLGSSLQGDNRERLAEIPGMVPKLSEELAGCAFAPRCSYATARCSRETPVLESKAEGHIVACFESDRVVAS